MLSRIKSAWRILRASDLPIAARLTLILAPLGRRGKRLVRMPLKRGACFLEPSSLAIDYRVFREIFVDRCYKTDYQNRPVLDLGAHRGYFGAYALLKGASRVLSYEPEAKNFAFLSRAATSFASSGSRWDVEHAAVGPTDGEALLRLRDQSWGHTLIEMDWVKVKGTQTVPVSSLERVLQRFSAEEGSLIVKIDIEGSEGALVMDTSIQAWSSVAELFIEIEPFCPVDRGSMLDRLAAAGLTSTGPTSGTIHYLVR